MQLNEETIKNLDSSVIVLEFFEDEEKLNAVKEILSKHFSGMISDLILKNFDRKLNETMTFPLQNKTKVVALGLGKKDEINPVKFREAVFKGVQAALPFSKENPICFVELPDFEGAKKPFSASIILGANMANYKFDKYKTKKSEKFEKFEILTDLADKSVEEGEDFAKIITDASYFTKDLIFESAEIMTPEKVAEIAGKMAENEGIEFKVYGKSELKEMGMNAFLAVGQGSAKEPKFIHLAYKPQNPRKKIALIGKGITFDSGGLDIKPASSMLTMKTDMSGCATVLGVMKAISKIKPDVELHVLSALCENMPSGTSYKVGDVLVSKSGKTIEVDNTDAEGRLTLADALTYADSINADEVIDIATLTGAVIVALGNNITGVMGNNQAQIDEFIATCKETGENIWQLPIYDDMKESLKSDIADMKNTGPRGAGASVAGWFLSNFTKSKKWLHIDIAGTAYIEKPYKDIQKGATAIMLRSLVKYIIK